MKKVLLIVMALIYTLFAQAQNYYVVHVESVESELFNLCSAEYDGVIFMHSQVVRILIGMLTVLITTMLTM